MISIPEIEIYDKIYIKKELADKNQLLQEFGYKIDEDFHTTLGETETHWTLAVGCLNRLKCQAVIDNRVDLKLGKPIKFTGALRPAQDRTLQQFYIDNVYKSGILKAKCGWGKSFWGVKMICEDSKPTLILVHTKLLLDQWVELFKNFTDYEPGIIGDGIYQPKDITVGLYISVNNRIEELKHRFSRVIVDEVHRCGADLFSETLNNFPALHRNGMSATPTRRDNRHVLFTDYFSDVFVEAEEDRSLIKPFVEIKKVPLRFEMLNPQRDWAKAITKAFSKEKYLDIIADDVNTLMSDGRTILLLAPRVEALRYLQKKIQRSLTLMGEDKNREEILSRVGKDINCILSTTIFDEGLSCHPLDTLVLTAPVGKNFAILEQRIGRIQRELPDKQPALLRVYWFQNFILEKQQNIEYMWYNAQGYQTRLI